jgi:hypothetical protein
MFEDRLVPERVYMEMERRAKCMGVDADKRGVEVDLSVWTILTDWCE